MPKLIGSHSRLRSASVRIATVHFTVDYYYTHLGNPTWAPHISMSPGDMRLIVHRPNVGGQIPELVRLMRYSRHAASVLMCCRYSMGVWYPRA
jgi:hypothetical protein